MFTLNYFHTFFQDKPIVNHRNDEIERRARLIHLIESTDPPVLKEEDLAANLPDYNYSDDYLPYSIHDNLRYPAVYQNSTSRSQSFARSQDEVSDYTKYLHRYLN